MRVTITTLADDIYNLEVSEDMELENFKALCEFESGIAASNLLLLWNGQPMQNNKMTLGQYGVKDGDMLLLQKLTQNTPLTPRNPTPTAQQPVAQQNPGSGLPMIDFGNIAVPGSSSSLASGKGPSHPAAQAGGGVPAGPDDPATLRQMLLNSPHDLALLKERNPPLAESLSSLEKFTEVLRKQQLERSERERERIRLMSANPFDPEIQEKIAEEIRLKNVESNMETAMEFSPESFGQVVMLYIDCQVNGHPVKAFVDSGAQMTIMSQACAERCNIMRLVDRRWAGIAKGVGTQKIIGRVHLCQIKIGDDFLQSSFSILEEQPMDMLLGLDMLRRHQCSIDLRTNKLVIGTTGNETTFLDEADLPTHARLNQTPGEAGSSQMDEDEQLAKALSKSAQEANRDKQ